MACAGQQHDVFRRAPENGLFGRRKANDITPPPLTRRLPAMDFPGDDRGHGRVEDDGRVPLGLDLRKHRARKNQRHQKQEPWHASRPIPTQAVATANKRKNAAMVIAGGSRGSANQMAAPPPMSTGTNGKAWP